MKQYSEHSSDSPSLLSHHHHICSRRHTSLLDELSSGLDLYKDTSIRVNFRSWAFYITWTHGQRASNSVNSMADDIQSNIKNAYATAHTECHSGQIMTNKWRMEVTFSLSPCHVRFRKWKHFLSVGKNYIENYIEVCHLLSLPLASAISLLPNLYLT